MELVYVHGRGWVPCCIEMHINCFMEIRVLLPFITIHRIIPIVPAYVHVQCRQVDLHNSYRSRNCALLGELIWSVRFQTWFPVDRFLQSWRQNAQNDKIKNPFHPFSIDRKKKKIIIHDTSRTIFPRDCEKSREFVDSSDGKEEGRRIIITLRQTTYPLTSANNAANALPWKLLASDTHRTSPQR